MPLLSLHGSCAWTALPSFKADIFNTDCISESCHQHVAPGPYLSTGCASDYPSPMRIGGRDTVAFLLSAPAWHSCLQGYRSCNLTSVLSFGEGQDLFRLCLALQMGTLWSRTHLVLESSAGARTSHVWLGPGCPQPPPSRNHSPTDVWNINQRSHRKG